MESIIIILVLAINTALMLMIIFLERKSPSSTWAWILVLCFLPVIGFLLYLVLGRNIYHKDIFEWDTKSYMHLKSTVDRQKGAIDKGKTYKNKALNDFSELAYLLLCDGDAPYSENNIVKPFTEGRELFKSIIEDIRSAKDHIHMVYFVLRNDKLGNRIVTELAEKARQGVKVRVLYDAFGSRELNEKFKARIIDAGGEIEAFFPMKFVNMNINFRNHRKLIIIDGDIGYIGGFNIGDEYIGGNPRYGDWRDTHLRMIGDAVTFIQTRFILDWNQAATNKVDFDGYYKPNDKHLGEVGVQIISSGPDSKWEQIKNAYIKMILSAKKYVYIQSPYFVPDQSMLDAIKIATLSGVDIKIMIPNKPDQPFVFWAAHSYIGELLQAGAKVYTYENGFLHAKTVVVDDMIASVGTANFDVRSFRLNFEVNAVIYHEEFARSLRRFFEQDIEVSKEKTIESYKKRAFIVRIKESLSRLLSPIL